MDVASVISFDFQPLAFHTEHKDLCASLEKRIKNSVPLCAPFSVSLCVNLKYYSMSGNLL